MHWYILTLESTCKCNAIFTIFHVMKSNHKWIVLENEITEKVVIGFKKVYALLDNKVSKEQKEL